MMKKSSYHILRVGLAITFLWIGLLILRDPEVWTGYVRPWTVELLPIPLTQVMIGTAVLDTIIGALLLIDKWTWLASLLGSLHLISVLTVAGITDITVRDIGLLSGLMAIFSSSIANKLALWKKPPATPPAASQ